jgi:tetratricopeptide (TPR) repeat protein
MTVEPPAPATDPSHATPVAPVPAPVSSVSLDLQAVAQISAAAIKASQDSLDQIKWVFSIGSLLITGLVAVLGFLGFQNIRNVSKSVRDEARKRVDEELAAAKITISVATQLAVRSQAALRLAFLAERWAEDEGNKTACYRKAISAIRDVRSAAETLDDPSTLSWTHSFEAYCLGATKQYQDAISEQLIAMQLAIMDEPLDHYNAACYYALLGNGEAAASQLRVAIENGGERFRTYAKNDLDFLRVRDETRVVDLLGPRHALSPMEAPEKAPPPIPVPKPN